MAGPVETTTPPLTDEAQLGRPDLGPPPFSAEAQLGSAPSEAPAPPTAFADFARSIFGQIEDAQTRAREAMQNEQRHMLEDTAALRDRYALIQEGMARVNAAHLARITDLDARKPQLAPPPSREIHQFLAPVQGEAPMQTALKVIQAATLFATGIGGLAKGDARAGLAAFSGAMRGWAEGDNEKADRQLADWKAKQESALKNWELERDSYLDWLGAANLSLDNMLKGAEMEAKVRGNEQAARAFATQEQTQALKYLNDTFQRAWQVQDSMQRFNEAVATHRAREAEQKARDEETARWHKDRAQADAENKQDRLRLERDRLEQKAWFEEQQIERWGLDRQQRDEASKRHEQTVAALKQLALDVHFKGSSYYDKEQGEIREITGEEWQADHANLMAGHPRFKMLRPKEAELADRLANAGPILTALDSLIKDITARAGPNITVGVINKLKKQAGIGAKIMQMRKLSVDSNLEETAALSSGVPRMTILHILREEGSAHDGMATDAALTVNQTVRTGVSNRLTRMTGDPEALTKLSRGLRPFAIGGAYEIEFDAPGKKELYSPR